jgi:hypothetical protein
MTLPLPGDAHRAVSHPVARRRSLESRGLHFIEHHQPWIWALIAAAAVMAVMARH